MAQAVAEHEYAAEAEAEEGMGGPQPLEALMVRGPAGGRGRATPAAAT